MKDLALSWVQRFLCLREGLSNPSLPLARVQPSIYRGCVSSGLTNGRLDSLHGATMVRLLPREWTLWPVGNSRLHLKNKYIHTYAQRNVYIVLCHDMLDYTLQYILMRYVILYYTVQRCTASNRASGAMLHGVDSISTYMI